ncbi:MAG: hypothetical protein IJS95_05420 [Prevotella sp.]|nr:hypothetical protein [Prevotella sp.]
MKKLFFSLVAAMIAATVTYAQSSMLATLSHEGEISTYYGASALREAHTAAVNGDVITLSGGAFNAVDITKTVTIRGAGMAVDNTAQTEPTILTGDFNISIAEDATGHLTIEGIYHNHTVTITSTLKNATFLKDRFSKITYSNSVVVQNLTMIHCRVANEIKLNNNSSLSCVNCVIQNPYMYNSTSAEYLNSIVVKINDSYCDYLAYSQFKNCILVAKYSSYSNYLNSDCVAYNCIAMGFSPSNMFKNIPNTTNSVKEYTDVFKTYIGTYNDDENFELTDVAKEAYKGIGGTEVGIYGGNMPFSTTPTNPQITKCNVAAKSTADGKLSVDITVNGAE